MYGFYKNKRIVLFDTLIEGYKSIDQKKKEEEAANVVKSEEIKKEGETKVNYS